MMIHIWKRLSTLFLLLMLMLMGGACTTAAPTEAPAAPQAEEEEPTAVSEEAATELMSITVADTTSVSQHAMPAIIKAKGFDKEEGIDLTVDSVPRSSIVGEGLAAGEIQVGQIAESTAGSLLSRGVPLKILSQIADSTRHIPLVVRDDLNVQCFEDLYGLTLGVSGGSAASSLFEHLLFSHELDRSQINVIDMNPSEIPPAYERDDVDGMITWPPALIRAMEIKPSVVLHDGYESYFPCQSGPDRLHSVRLVLMAQKDFIPGNAEAIKAYMRAYNRALEFANSPETSEEAIQIVAEATGLSPEDIEKVFKGSAAMSVKWTLMVDEDFAQTVHDSAQFFYEQERIPEPPPEDMGTWIDPTLLKEAVPEMVEWEPGS